MIKFLAGFIKIYLLRNCISLRQAVVVYIKQLAFNLKIGGNLTTENTEEHGGNHGVVHNPQGVEVIFPG